jgi:hypothetical protein
MNMAMWSDDFAVFILTYGRPNAQYTAETLNRCGYTGKIYYVCSTDDKTLPEYQDKYGSDVLTFDKDEVAKQMDLGDNFDDKRAVVYARCAIYAIAKTVKVKYFLVLDDDYCKFKFRIASDLQYSTKNQVMHQGLDRLFEVYLAYYKEINATTIAMAQGGDFIGGAENDQIKFYRSKRKAMNTFFTATDKQINFVGRINEDLTTSVIESIRGNLFLTIPFTSVEQKQTQLTPGGLTEIYLNLGTYVKSFYSVMFAPSCVKVVTMGNKFRRLHHQVAWNHAAPKILSEKHRKIS